MNRHERTSWLSHDQMVRLLNLPEDARIVSIASDHETGGVCLVIDSPTLQPEPLAVGEQGQHVGYHESRTVFHGDDAPPDLVERSWGEWSVPK